MRHIPHLVLQAPLTGDQIEVSPEQWHHLSKVLRMRAGEPVTYTDGRGLYGQGALAEKAVRRGSEHKVDRPSELSVAVAPPTGRERQRFLVEKLAELGVARLLWLRTRHGEGRIPPHNKVQAWATGAVEQSRGAWLMEAGPDLVGLIQLEAPVVVCHPGGPRQPPHAATVVIGPEGGFADDELDFDHHRWNLGPTVLRVETAAMVAAARIIGQQET